MDLIYDLSRFTIAHEKYHTYQTALREIRNGHKESHWMWFIFPQMRGLGMSCKADYYGISGLEEAKAFLDDPYLGGNLREISGALLELDSDNAYQIFDSPDNIKLRSSMTLFAIAAGEGSVFEKVLDKFFRGRKDGRTLELLGL